MFKKKSIITLIFGENGGSEIKFKNIKEKDWSLFTYRAILNMLVALAVTTDVPVHTWTSSLEKDATKTIGELMNEGDTE